MEHDPNEFIKGFSESDNIVHLEPADNLARLRKNEADIIFPMFWTGTGVSHTNNGRVAMIQTADTQINYLYWTIMIPRSRRITDIALLWECNQTGNMYGELYFDISKLNQSRTASTKSTTTMTLNNPTASTLAYTSLRDIIPLPQLTNGDVLFINIVRNANQANDTLNSTAEIYGLVVYYN